MNNHNIVDIERSNRVQKTNCVPTAQDSFFIRIIYVPIGDNILNYTLIIALDEMYLTINQLRSISMLIRHLMIPYEFVLMVYHRD